MKHEKSCGAVLYTKVNGEIMYCLVQQLSGFRSFPKGHMEGNETELETAKREILEEVGIVPQFIDGFRMQDHYNLKEKKDTDKTVTIFLAKYENQTIKYQKEELLSADLYPFDIAIKLVTYEASKEILRSAHNFILEHNL